MKVKKIHCLLCDSILEADFDNGISYAECNCENQTSLTNSFRISQPGSYVRAIDKTKVMAQALYDIEALDLKKDDWFFLIQPENESSPKYKKWIGKYGGNCSGLVEGLLVSFETNSPMTFNECRIYLKTNFVAGADGQIYHLVNGVIDE
jgi:hypothetical protein